MNQRGFTLLEVVISTMVLSIILFGIGTFFVSSTRVEKNNDAQTYLQRQATIIFDEMVKQIGEATPGTLVIGCGGIGDALQVQNSRGTYCFRRDVAGTGLFMDTPSGTWDLLQGSPVTLTTASGTCPSTGGFCASLVIPNGLTAAVGAAVTLRLRYQFAESASYQIMTFTNTIAVRSSS